MKKSILSLFIVFGLFIISSFANEIKYKLNFTKETSCEIRKIKLYENPTWASKIDLKDGRSIFFCSPKSMFEFYYTEDKWSVFGIKSLEDFQNILVTDYKTLKIIDAQKAFFVYGSNKTSPAGDDLVVFESKVTAEEYAKNNDGKRVLSFSEVKNSLIRLLNGRI
ncbi:MAG: nitrous oxide reductase accessory protein NosL [Arcobacteraceae bacterium]